MPKKFAGENSKAVAARQRKEAVKEAEKQKKQKEIEDAYWEDDDKNAKKRQKKKEDQEKKKQDLLSKKAEAKEQLEKEMSGISKVAKVLQPKITRAQIAADSEKRVIASQKTKPVSKEPSVEVPLEENLNRALPEEIATTIDEAIAMLSDTKLAPDKHPEKRLKAAYLAFEEKNLPILKEENPTLRMSQLKQMLYKEWQKSSENPLNKPLQ